MWLLKCVAEAQRRSSLELRSSKYSLDAGGCGLSTCVHVHVYIEVTECIGRNWGREGPGYHSHEGMKGST